MLAYVEYCRKTDVRQTLKRMSKYGMIGAHRRGHWIMLKILVADSTQELCTALRETFDDRYEVAVCHNGKDALSMLYAMRPDILWLDLTLPGMDGISILQTAALAGIYPDVIVSLRQITDYIQNALSSFGVKYLVRKPVNLVAAMIRIEDLAQRHLQCTELSAVSIDALIYNRLLLHGACGRRAGHSCLEKALQIAVRNPGVISAITKELYPAVAAVCGGTPERVERAIRIVITAAWANRDEQIWQMLFADYSGCCPSNGVFIARLAHSLINEKERRSTMAGDREVLSMQA